MSPSPQRECGMWVRPKSLPINISSEELECFGPYLTPLKEWYVGEARAVIRSLQRGSRVLWSPPPLKKRVGGCGHRCQSASPLRPQSPSAPLISATWAWPQLYYGGYGLQHFWQAFSACSTELCLSSSLHARGVCVCVCV